LQWGKHGISPLHCVRPYPVSLANAGYPYPHNTVPPILNYGLYLTVSAAFRA